MSDSKLTRKWNKNCVKEIDNRRSGSLSTCTMDKE